MSTMIEVNDFIKIEQFSVIFKLIYDGYEITKKNIYHTTVWGKIMVLSTDTNCYAEEIPLFYGSDIVIKEWKR